MLMSENDNPEFNDLRKKNTKKAMVSLMATPDDAAVAEIMFDQMTEEDKEKVCSLVFRGWCPALNLHYFLFFFLLSSAASSSIRRREARKTTMR